MYEPCKNNENELNNNSNKCYKYDERGSGENARESETICDNIKPLNELN